MACKGTVKAVLSGDTICLCGKPQGGPPVEKTLTLTGIIAPKVAMRSSTREVPDEPFGYPAREFLRKLLIGKEVQFTLDAVEREREFGTVILSDGSNVAEVVLREGYARVRGGPRGPVYEAYKAAEQEAAAAGKGIWATGDAGLATIREINYLVNEYDKLRQFVEENKGAQLQAIVEFIRDGGNYRCYFPDVHTYGPVSLIGVSVDSRKRVPGTEIFQDQPFAAEARYFAEMRTLSQDVTVTVHSYDSECNILGQIESTAGDMGTLLVRGGYASVQDWSIRGMPFAAQLYEAQAEAQARKVRKWRHYKPTEDKPKQEYEAKVVEIVSGDCLVVVPVDNRGIDVERRLYLASIRCPRAGNRIRKTEDEPYAFEAKEFARKRLIGKKVHIAVDYTRMPNAAPGVVLPPASDEDGNLHFVSVQYDNKKRNLSEDLVREGLASVMLMRNEDPRASNYQVLLEAQEEAKAAKKGIHNDKDAPRTRINDLVGPENSRKAKDLANSILALNEFDGVVDYVFNGGRYKLRIPKEGLAIPFSLAGVRAPANRPNQKPEPFALEALNWAKRLLMQRNVKAKVVSVDRNGNFFGRMMLGDNCVNVMITAEGLARTFEISLRQIPDASLRQALMEAENEARLKRANMWMDDELFYSFDPETLGAPKATDVPKVDYLDEAIASVTLSCVFGIDDFYIQDESKAVSLEEVMSRIDDLLEENSMVMADRYTEGNRPKKGEILLAKFTVDDQWYRARVTAYDDKFKQVSVSYLDYGNSEKLPLTAIRRCPPELAKVEPLARHCALAGVKTHPDYAEEATERMTKLTEAGRVSCVIESMRENSAKQKVANVYLACVEDATGGAKTINELLVEEGYVLVDKTQSTKTMAKLLAMQDVARKNRSKAWRHGAIDSDPDED